MNTTYSRIADYLMNKPCPNPKCRSRKDEDKSVSFSGFDGSVRVECEACELKYEVGITRPAV